jgi:phage replication-related protein YjqB (UPF0714/DUF867 family)
MSLTVLFFAQSASATSPDYQIVTRDVGSPVLSMAIHGGKIETGTSELASTLASDYNYNYYSLMGEMNSNNYLLHVTATQFDEPTALKMVAKSSITISVHGCIGSNQFTYIGGRDTNLMAKIQNSLVNSGFTCLTPPSNLAGASPANICNKNLKGEGVQLEISLGLRQQFLKDNATLQRYAATINNAISSK